MPRNAPLLTLIAAEHAATPADDALDCLLARLEAEGQPYELEQAPRRLIPMLVQERLAKTAEPMMVLGDALLLAAIERQLGPEPVANGRLVLVPFSVLWDSATQVLGKLLRRLSVEESRAALSPRFAAPAFRPA